MVAAALDLFTDHGFEQTSVAQIAEAAGVSRSTFFRQFGGKDDVVFTDHDVVLAELRAFFSGPHADPWLAVCDAAVLVFRRFAAEPDLARRRYALVRGVPALREREIVTVFAYERLFDEHLRQARPGLDPVDAVSFAAAVAAVHNHVLRRMLRGDDVPEATLIEQLRVLRERFGVAERAAAADDDLVVAVFPRAMPAAELARKVAEHLT